MKIARPTICADLRQHSPHLRLLYEGTRHGGRHLRRGAHGTALRTAKDQPARGRRHSRLVADKRRRFGRFVLHHRDADRRVGASHQCVFPIIAGPGPRAGAIGTIQSVYIRDPDQNPGRDIELLNAAMKISDIKSSKSPGRRGQARATQRPLCGSSPMMVCQDRRGVADCWAASLSAGIVARDIATCTDPVRTRFDHACTARRRLHTFVKLGRRGIDRLRWRRSTSRFGIEGKLFNQPIYKTDRRAWRRFTVLRFDRPQRGALASTKLVRVSRRASKTSGRGQNPLRQQPLLA